MPRRDDIKSILIIGSGPVVIGQACEFDYAGVQACAALKEEGYRVILINSNPASVMTDKDLCDVTYIEPISLEMLVKIIEKERPNALLATVGGQVALNSAIELDLAGILSKYQVEMLGIDIATIQRAEDRASFHKVLQEAEIPTPRSIEASCLQEALHGAQELKYPLLFRSSFSLGGLSSRLIYTEVELAECYENACSLAKDVSLTQALIGWKEFEIEVMIDAKGQCVAVCSIENIDPLGVHTGDSITVSPALTLSDKEYQRMRVMAFTIVKAVGMRCGGANVQFAMDPKTRSIVAIEMNPRVSRSSALVSKATCYPIARIAAKLSVGLSLDEILGELSSKELPAFYEPSLDYVVVKIPMFQFEKFPHVEDVLSTTMQSMGEVMAFGSSFSEALLKAMASVEKPFMTEGDLRSSKRLEGLMYKLYHREDLHTLQGMTHIDPWFLYKMQEIACSVYHLTLNASGLSAMKKIGLSDAYIASLYQKKERDIRHLRWSWNIRPSYKRCDSTAGDYISRSEAFYSSYFGECELELKPKPKILIIGSGASRIGQGIEFDYMSVKAIQAVKRLGFDAIMVNCNPETVSTDAHVASRLYFSAISVEEVLEIIHKEKPYGTLLQWGGQSAIDLAKELEEEGVHLLGISSSMIDLCEDRAQFQALLKQLSLPHPKGSVTSVKAPPPMEFHYPLIVRPSYILGGRGVQQVGDLSEWNRLISCATTSSIFVEEFLQDAIELDVDCITDGVDVVIPAIIQQVEPCGIHSGDSKAFFPFRHLSEQLEKQLLEIVKKLVSALRLRGVCNIQCAIAQGDIIILEVNPRASRTLPFLCKAQGVDWVAVCIEALLHKGLRIQEVQGNDFIFMKGPVFPHERFGPLTLGPEMLSTGEVMAIGSSWEEVWAKTLVASGEGREDLSSFDIRSLQEIDEKRPTRHL